MQQGRLVVWVISGVAIISGCGAVNESANGPSSLASITASGAVSGEPGRIRVIFSNPVAAATDVMLRSESPGIATVPDLVTVVAGAVSADVAYTAVAPGRAVFQATAGEDTQTTSATVVDMLRVNPRTGTTFEVGAHSVIAQDVAISVPDAITVSLASSQPSVATVEGSVTIPVFSSSGVAQIAALSPGASIITASYNGYQATQTVTIVDKARIVQSYGTSVYEIGGRGIVQVALSAQLANPTQLTITPSDPSVINVPRTYTIAPGSNYAYLDVQAMAAGSTKLEFSLNGSSDTLPISVLSKAQLEGVTIDGVMSVNYSSQLTVNLNVIAASAHDVALTSSDPTVVSVPPMVTVFAGTSSASASIMPLKAGSAVITATHNGISRQINLDVGGAQSGYALNLYGQNRYIAGTIGALSIQTGLSTVTSVSLVSSDPSVVSVPPSIVVVNSSETAPLTVLHSGTTTITATANGATATFPLSVVATPGIQQFGPSFSVPVNGTTNGYLALDTLPRVGTKITFATSDASVAAAPAEITTIDGQSYLPLSIRGGNSGTATLTATVAGTTASAVVYVGGTAAGQFNSLFVNNSSTIEIGAATLLYAYFNPPPPSGDTGTIAFTTPGILSTPSTSLNISPTSCCNYFPVVGAVAGTSEVTVTVGGFSQAATIRVVSSPTYTLQVPGTVKPGSSVLAHIVSDAGVAADRTFRLSSSNTSVATVTSATAVIGPGGTLQTSFGVHGVAAGTAKITATINGTTLTGDIVVQ